MSIREADFAGVEMLSLVRIEMIVDEWSTMIDLERRRVRFAPYKNRLTLHVNFSNCSAREIYHQMRRVTDCISTQPRGSVLALTDFAGLSVETPILSMMKELAVLNKPFVKKSALTGTFRLPREFKDGLGIYSQREFGIFATREEALRWLVV